MNSSGVLPGSVAIAGFGGYIGSKLAEAALKAGVRVYGFDPFALASQAPTGIEVVPSEEIFYSLCPSFYHLALHPDARDSAQQLLFSRAANEPMAILMEKPMAPPEDPQSVKLLIDTIEQSKALVLYDFPELFDPLTAKIVEFLQKFKSVEFYTMTLVRSKDREEDTPRNRKKIVPIQFQESVHCLAFFLYLVGKVQGSYHAAVKNGVSVQASSRAYEPPNPKDYQYVVDGRCDYEFQAGNITVRGVTNFKRGAESAKQRIVHGVADGTPFCIEVDYFEGTKYLKINGVDQQVARDSCSYTAVLSTFTTWQEQVGREELHRGVYPHCHFAALTYALSGMLWRSCAWRCEIEVGGVDELICFNSGFLAAKKGLPKY
jgi:predicted dehydrogenase